MSHLMPERSNEEHKITPVNDNSTNAKKNNSSCKACCSSSQHDDACNDNGNEASCSLLNPKNTNKEKDLANSLESLQLSPNDSSLDNTALPNTTGDWLKVKDSLENIPFRDKTGTSDITSSKSCTSSKEKRSLSESGHLHESQVGTSKSTCANSVSKVLAWDPWDKLGRKNKKENKRRKCEKVNDTNKTAPSHSNDKNRNDFSSSGDEARALLPPEIDALVDEGHEYEYQPYQKNNNNLRSVEFTNNVMVVYINREDKVVGESSEPLKKELEQQIRNKEMRKGHMPDVAFAKRSGGVSDWFKK